MRFPPVEDITGFGTQSFNINELDEQMHNLIRDIRFAVTHNHVLTKKSRELTSALDDLLLQHSYTHQSMRLLLKQAYRKSDFPIVADTASIAREQVEKIYQAIILIQDPHRWIRQYLRNGWQKDFENYLLELDEYGAIDRHKEFLDHYFEGYIERSRHLTLRPKGPKLISAFAKKVVEWEWNNKKFGKLPPKPAWFNRKGSVNHYLAKYFFFPTPGAVMTKIKNRQLYVFLDRWYREYRMLSEYSHVLTGKVLLQRVGRDKSAEATEKALVYGKKKAEYFILISNIAGASLCTVILPHLPNSYGSRNTAKEYWIELCKGSLLAKALWKLYAEKALG